jgi:hypothetical protein
MTEKVSDTKIKKIKDLKTQHPDWGCRRIAKAVDLHYVTVSKKLKELGLNHPERSPKRINPRLGCSSNPTKPSPSWKEAAKSEKSFGALIPRGYQEKKDETPKHFVEPELKISKTYYTDQDYGDGYGGGEICWKALGLMIGIPATLTAAVCGISKFYDWQTKRRAEGERKKRIRELANRDYILNTLLNYEVSLKKMGDKEALINVQKAIEEWVKILEIPPDSPK